MATADTNKPGSTKSSSKPRTSGSRSSSAKRSSSPRNNNSNSRSARSTRNGSGFQVGPYSATTIASLVGVGVALGFGLFATRGRWMPYAGELNEQLHERWDQYTHRDDYDDDDHSDYSTATTGNSGYGKDEDMASATFPGDSTRTTT
jgi:hypothetical protein